MPSSRPAASNGSNRSGGMPSTGRPRSLPRSNENSWSSFDTCASCWSSSWPGPTEVLDPNVFRDAAFPPPRRHRDVWCALLSGAGIFAPPKLGDLAGPLRAQALPKLKGLAGVCSVVITGAPTDEVDVTLDPAKLAANRVTVTQVAAALQQASIVASIGSLKQASATIPPQVSGPV